MKSWQKEICSSRPAEIDYNSCPGHILQRRSIEEKTVKNEDGSDRIEYECEMRFLTSYEFAEQNRADIEYLAIMGGVEL